MLSLNSLSAFTQDVTRNAGIRQPVRGTERPDAARGAAPAQRILQSAPPAGGAPPGAGALPRGSLLDLRV